MVAETRTEIISWLVLIGGVIGAIGGISALVRFIKRKRKERMEKKNFIINTLKDLCVGQQSIFDKLINVDDRLTEMDALRTQAREEDAYVRTRMYLGTVAGLDATMRLATHLHLEINGDVSKYRAENIENLKKGIGINPLNMKGHQGMEKDISKRKSTPVIDLQN